LSSRDLFPPRCSSPICRHRCGIFPTFPPFLVPILSEKEFQLCGIFPLRPRLSIVSLSFPSTNRALPGVRSIFLGVKLKSLPPCEFCRDSRPLSSLALPSGLLIIVFLLICLHYTKFFLASHTLSIRTLRLESSRLSKPHLSFPKSARHLIPSVLKSRSSVVAVNPPAVFLEIHTWLSFCPAFPSQWEFSVVNRQRGVNGFLLHHRLSYPPPHLFGSSCLMFSHFSPPAPLLVLVSHARAFPSLPFSSFLLLQGPS